MTHLKKLPSHRSETVKHYLVLAASLLALSAFAAGCQSNEAEFRPVAKGVRVKAAPSPHEHGEEGPHGGHLVELGEEEYHAEVVLDVKAKAVDVYVLASDPHKPQAIDAKEVVLELKIDGKTGPHAAKPSPQKDDPPGKSSRFILADDPDIKAKIDDEHELEGHVNVTINGKAYSGAITHEHASHHDHTQTKKG
jgi:hypothetical protein